MMKKETMSIRKIQAAETKSRIYESADELFKKYGFEKVSVDAIVEKAGVSKGSFYVHFNSKASLIAALITDLVSKVDLNYRTFMETFPPQVPTSDILIALAGKIADTLTDTLGYELMKLAYETLLTRTVDAGSITGYNRDLYKLFSAIIAKGIETGEFRADIPAETIAAHYVMAFRGLTYEWCIRYPHFDLKAQVLKHFEMLINGINSNNSSS